MKLKTYNEKRAQILQVAGVTTGTWSLVQDSFFDSDICTSTARASRGTLTGFSPTTTVNMKLASTYSAWPTDIWEIGDGEYPRIRWSPSQ